MRRSHPDYQAEPFRVTWIKESGNSDRTYASEAAARSALSAPFSANVREAVLDRMEFDEKHIYSPFCWHGVRMASRKRRSTDRR